MKFAARSSQLKQYNNKYPEKQVITMLDLARYMEIYECAPHIVSKGKQKTLQQFADEIKKSWQKSDVQFNAYYYKRVVALAILYRKTDEIIKQSNWYKEKKSYKANVIAYTLSLIFYYIRVHNKGYELDFIRIWNLQDIYDELQDQIQILSEEVYKFITGPRDTENVTEWCKKDACWLRAKSQIWTFNDPFLHTLVPQDDVKQQKTAEENVKSLDLRKGTAIIVDPKAENATSIPTDQYSSWQLYRKRLLDNGFKKESVEEIERATLKILKHLSGDTRESGPVKGLVIGNVQSGKTANMAALMAMAADWGWNMFIILSGTIENLRIQTQTRLFNDLNQTGNIFWRSLEHLSKTVDMSQKAQNLHFDEA